LIYYVFEEKSFPDVYNNGLMNTKIIILINWSDSDGIRDNTPNINAIKHKTVKPMYILKLSNSHPIGIIDTISYK
jgi:hypothetical protein